MATIDELLFRNPRLVNTPPGVPLGSGGEPLPMPGGDRSWIRSPQEAAWAQSQLSPERAQQQYQDELESAERLRRQQEIQRLLDSGLRPPAALSAPATPPPPILRTLGNRIYSFDRATGEPTLTVQGAAKQPQRQRGYTQAEVDAYGPLEQGYEWAPSAYPGFFEPVRKRQQSALETLLGGGTALTPPSGGTAAPQLAPPASSRTKNTIYQTPKGPLRWTGTGWVNP